MSGRPTEPPRGEKPSRHVSTLQLSEDRLLSQAEGEAVLKRFQALPHRNEWRLPFPEIWSWWSAGVRWGRNRVTLASDRRDVQILAEKQKGGLVATNQLDDASLGGLVRTMELKQRKDNDQRDPSFEYPLPVLPTPQPTIWSDATYALTSEALSKIVRGLIGPAEAAGLLSAGYLELRAGSRLWHANGEQHYVRFTQAQCSLTVRDSRGRGSGWAGLSSYDWAKIDAPALAARALAKCTASLEPVALEPGRYTVILEPQAVADLLEILVGAFDRAAPETDGSGPFDLYFDNDLKIWRTRLGLRVVDDRLTLEHDPADPDLGIMPEPGTVPVSWIERGMLTNLVYDRDYSVQRLNEDFPVRSPQLSYRLRGSGATTSVDEMIATTKRGLLVTRFKGIRQLDGESLLSTGLTRDGLWLIENGKIVKPVKNFRFVESPLFILNRVEQIGTPVPVFRPAPPIDPIDFGGSVARNYYSYVPGLTPAMVPPLKARDFSFTAIADAV